MQTAWRAKGNALLLLTLFAGLSLAVLAVGIFRLRSALKGTTLRTAWRAAVVTWAVHVAVWVVTVGGVVPAAVESHLWYAVGLLLLCPPVAVLGARRPVADAWPWFVLVPLIFVFSIPSLTTLWRGGWTTPLQLETPTLLGFAFVLTMGAGNYLFTRFTLSAMLYASGVILLILPVTSFADNFDLSPNAWYHVGTIAVGTAMLRGILIARSRHLADSPLEATWRDFRNTFGVVWAKRVMDRINWTAQEEKWSLRLSLTGIVPQEGEPVDHERARQRLEEVLRWLLKRFVDDVWMNRRLG